MIKLVSRTAFYLGLLLVIALSLLPPDAMPPTGLWDKASHTLAYTVLAATGCIAHRGIRAWVLVAAGLLILGAALEIVQSALPGRVASFHDLGANAIGIALGALLAVGADTLWARRRPAGT